MDKCRHSQALDTVPEKSISPADGISLRVRSLGESARSGKSDDPHKKPNIFQDTAALSSLRSEQHTPPREVNPDCQKKEEQQKEGSREVLG